MKLLFAHSVSLTRSLNWKWNYTQLPSTSINIRSNVPPLSCWVCWPIAVCSREFLFDWWNWTGLNMKCWLTIWPERTRTLYAGCWPALLLLSAARSALPGPGLRRLPRHCSTAQRRTHRDVQVSDCGNHTVLVVRWPGVLVVGAAENGDEILRINVAGLKLRIAMCISWF